MISFEVSKLADIRRDLLDLSADIRLCKTCPIGADVINQYDVHRGFGKSTGSGLPFGIMFVGTNPSTRRTPGEPIAFRGGNGQIFRDHLIDLGFAHGSTYFTNAVRCTNRRSAVPTTRMFEHCAPFLYREVAIVEPKFVVFLGDAPADYYGTQIGLRTYWSTLTEFTLGLEIGDSPIFFMRIWHPTYAIRFRQYAKHYDDQLLLVKTRFEEILAGTFTIDRAQKLGRGRR
jgi:uracil-DNA glycosylase family 4